MLFSELSDVGSELVDESDQLQLHLLIKLVEFLQSQQLLLHVVVQAVNLPELIGTLTEQGIGALTEKGLLGAWIQLTAALSPLKGRPWCFTSQHPRYVLEFLSDVKDEPNGLGLIVAEFYDLEEVLVAEVHVNGGFGELGGVFDFALPAPDVCVGLIVLENQVGAFLDSAILALERLEDELAMFGGVVHECEAVDFLFVDQFVVLVKGQVASGVEIFEHELLLEVELATGLVVVGLQNPKALAGLHVLVDLEVFEHDFIFGLLVVVLEGGFLLGNCDEISALYVGEPDD